MTLNLELRLSKAANTQRTYSQPESKAEREPETVQVAGRKTDMNYKEKVH